MPPQYLEQYVDTSIEVPEEWDHETYAQEQIERLVKQAFMAYHASTVPRRLGGGASRIELARDKKISKKLAWRAIKALNLWDPEFPPQGSFGSAIAHLEENYPELDTEELRIEGTQVNWPEWYAGYTEYMRKEIRFVATTAKEKVMLKIGRKYVNRLENELFQTHDAWQMIVGE